MQGTLIPSPVTTQKRAYALDALRGFAILTMVLSGTIAYRILPAWMYHAQEPPPTHTFNPHLPGLTWVDLVFPLFLFSMGAAIPLALSRRLAKGLARSKIILSILKRGFLLGTFAIVLQHLRPQVINPDPTPQTWWIALLGFFILFFMFARWPDSWSIGLCRVLTLGAWCSAIILLACLRYPDGIAGGGFSVYRSDIILILLFLAQ
jgi:predicted acyltransferase